MKLMIATALLFLVAGVPARGLQQEPDKAKEKDRPRPEQQEEPKKQEREKQRALPPEKEGQQPDPRQEKQQAEKARRQTEKQQQQGEKQQQQADKDRTRPDNAARERTQRQEESSAHQTQRDGGNRNTRRIREEDFRSHFGDEHHFHVERRDDRRFRYSGYWFEFSDPWPREWGYADDVYIDDIDGEYYLIDPARPGIRLLVIVVD
jgi:hypothetical protein